MSTVMVEKRPLYPNQVRALRKSRGWSRSDFANALGIKPAALTHYENGSRFIPRERAEHMARLLECDPLDLFVSRIGNIVAYRVESPQ